MIPARHVKLLAVAANCLFLDRTLNYVECLTRVRFTTDSNRLTASQFKMNCFLVVVAAIFVTTFATAHCSGCISPKAPEYSINLDLPPEQRWAEIG